MGLSVPQDYDPWVKKVKILLGNSSHFISHLGDSSGEISNSEIYMKQVHP